MIKELSHMSKAQIKGKKERFHDSYAQEIADDGANRDNNGAIDHDVYNNLTPQFREIVKMSQEEDFKKRIDKSIMHSYFLNQFDDDLSIFVKKFNLDKKTLGPWFKADMLKIMTSADNETEFIKTQIKQIRRKYSKYKKLSPLAKFVLSG